MKYCLLPVMLVLTACGPRDPSQPFYAFYQTIPTVSPKAAEEPFPGERVPPPEVCRAIAEAESVRDLFPIERFIKLEGAVIGEITQIVKLGGHFFIFDRIQGVVHKFTEEGQFVCQIGRKGEGPGEYVQAGQLEVVWGTHLAVQDALRGFLLVYDQDGRFVQATARPGADGDAGKFPLTNSVIWDQPERMYLSDFPTLSAGVPHHVALDMSEPGGKTLFGFGERHPRFMAALANRKVNRFKYISFDKINDRIWAAEPAAAYIDVYTMEGRHLGKVFGPHVDNLTMDDHVDKPEGRMQEMRFMMSRFHNARMIHYGDLVLQTLTAGARHHMNIYDINGNLLRHSLPSKRGGSSYKTAEGDSLICVLPFTDRPDAYPMILSPAEMELLLEAGWHPETYLDENEYLCIRRPKWAI